jgi:phosphatidylethanolamine-binding protein (PEBP) family uncharacterized protein
VAQGTGSVGFLASLAKGAGTRVILVSALAALLLGGCGGGGSSEEGPASTDTTASGVSESAGQGGMSKAREDASRPPAATSAQGIAGSDSGVEGGATAEKGGGAKRGQRVAQPTGPRERAPTPSEIAEATVADMSLASPAIAASSEGPGRLPATYTCDGQGDWPALRWSGVPAGTEELILYAMNIQPVEGQLFVDWAVAGLDPGLEEIEAGKLPTGAVVGTNGFGERGYEVCPSGSEIYVFAIYALPRALSPRKGFDARELRRQILDVSGNVGLLPVAYSRG